MFVAINVPPYNKYWPEDGLVKPKHVTKTMYYWLYIDVVLRLNKSDYWILNTVDKVMLAYSSIKFIHVQFFIFLVVIRTDTPGAKCPPTPDTSIHGRGTWSFGFSCSIQDVSVYMDNLWFYMNCVLLCVGVLWVR